MGHLRASDVTRDGPSAEKTRRATAPDRPLPAYLCNRTGRDLFDERISVADFDYAVPHPSSQFAASPKLSVFLMNRSAIAPLAGAALVPFAIAGATKLPYKEVFSLVKKLLVL